MRKPIEVIMRSRHWLLLLVLVAVPFATGLPHGFVYDDHGSIEENLFLDEPGNIRKLLTFQTLTDSAISDGRRPLVILSYLLDRAVWGINPFGYHLTNLFLHLIVVVLVLLLILALIRGVQPERGAFLAFAAALLFGLHPVLTETVQSPAFREDILLTLFVLMFLLATARQRTVWLSIPLLVLALLAKESAVVAPVLLLWMWICFPTIRPRCATVMALAGVSVAMAIFFFALWFKSGSLQAATEEGAPMAVPFPANLLTAPWLWVKALRVLVWPRPLIVDYAIEPISHISHWQFLVGTVALLACVTLAFTRIRRAPWIAFGMGWMLIGFVPVSNIVPLYNPFAERYLYLISVGFALIAAQWISVLPEKRWRCLGTQPDQSGKDTGSRVPVLFLVLICVTYSGLIVDRLTDWTDDFSLWSRTLRQVPRSARAHTWVGLEYKKRWEIERALKHFSEADRMNPQEISGLINIAVLYGQDGRLAEAEQLLREAIRRRPDKADAHWNLAVALDAQGRKDEAMTELEKTRKLNPRYPAAVTYNHLAVSEIGTTP